jgi:hypothetical protein
MNTNLKMALAITAILAALPLPVFAAVNVTVPEPGIGLMLASGLVAVGGLRYYIRKK